MVAANSDAADELARRLTKKEHMKAPGVLRRLNVQSSPLAATLCQLVDWETPHPDLRQYLRAVPPDSNCHDAVNAGVVICTLAGANLIRNSVLGEGFFTHIMLDDAATMTEPEACIAISLAGPHTKVVIAGDPIPERSPVQMGELKHSILARLVDRADSLDPNPRTQAQRRRMNLVHSYDLSKPLLRVVSSLWYSDTLIAGTVPLSTLNPDGKQPDRLHKPAPKDSRHWVPNPESNQGRWQGLDASIESSSIAYFGIRGAAETTNGQVKLDLDL